MSAHEHSPGHDRLRHSESDRPSFWTSRAGLVAIGFLAIIGFLLFMEHRAHVLGALPYLLILACPLMHLFMHGSHGGHGHGGGNRPNPPDRGA